MLRLLEIKSCQVFKPNGTGSKLGCKSRAEIKKESNQNIFTKDKFQLKWSLKLSKKRTEEDERV